MPKGGRWDFSQKQNLGDWSCGIPWLISCWCSSRMNLNGILSTRRLKNIKGKAVRFATCFCQRHWMTETFNVRSENGTNNVSFYWHGSFYSQAWTAVLNQSHNPFLLALHFLLGKQTYQAIMLNTEIKQCPTLVSPLSFWLLREDDQPELMFLSFQGSIVLPNIASSLYDPEHWETPRQFNPGHFLDKDGNFVSQEAFLPFSIGKFTDSTNVSGLGWGCRSKTSLKDLLVIYFNPLCEKQW